MNDPIIFFDFDGVLNSIASMIGLGAPNIHFDPVAVGLVHKLAAATNAKIVISSSWRIGRTVDELKMILNKTSHWRHDWSIVIDKTPAYGYGDVSFDFDFDMRLTRGSEIAQWRKNRKHTGRYVIIDDDSDMREDQLLFFVKCNTADGFGLQQYIRALRLLSPNHPDVASLSAYYTYKKHAQIITPNQS